MRLLHTSDWHLGRTLHGESLLEHQAVFLDWLLAQAVGQEVDAVVVAGDVYDRAVPPVDAVRLLDRDADARSPRAGIPVLMISGNHDSAVRLGFGSGLSEAAGIHLRTSLGDLARPVVLTDDAGEVAVYGIPYLLPDAVMADLGAERSHASVLAAAAALIHADAARPRHRPGGDRGARVRHRAARQRVRAGHPRSAASATPRPRCSAGAELRGARAPARPAGRGRARAPAGTVAAVLAGRRWRSRSPSATTASRCRWWTSRPGGEVAVDARWPRRCRGRCARCADAWTSCWPGRRPGRPGRGLGQGGAHRPGAGRPRPWSGCARSGRTPSCSTSSPRAAWSRRRRTCGRLARAADPVEICGLFVEYAGGGPPDAGRAAGAGRRGRGRAGRAPRRWPDAPARPGAAGHRPVRRAAADRLRARWPSSGLFLLEGPTGARQDDHPGRDHVRAVRRAVGGGVGHGDRLHSDFATPGRGAVGDPGVLAAGDRLPGPPRYPSTSGPRSAAAGSPAGHPGPPGAAGGRPLGQPVVQQGRGRRAWSPRRSGSAGSSSRRSCCCRRASSPSSCAAMTTSGGGC